MKVVEARGLMARDGMLGKSDPYVNLALTGRLVFPTWLYADVCMKVVGCAIDERYKRVFSTWRGVARGQNVLRVTNSCQLLQVFYPLRVGPEGRLGRRDKHIKPCGVDTEWVRERRRYLH